MQHYFNTDFAAQYGVPAAIIAQNFWYWARQNEKDGKNYYEGRYWLYDSVREMSEVFYYLSPNKIRGAIDLLVKKGVLLKGNFNRVKYDRTSWYAFTDYGTAIYQTIEMEMSKTVKESA